MKKQIVMIVGMTALMASLNASAQGRGNPELRAFEGKFKAVHGDCVTGRQANRVYIKQTGAKELTIREYGNDASIETVEIGHQSGPVPGSPHRNSHLETRGMARDGKLVSVTKYFMGSRQTDESSIRMDVTQRSILKIERTEGHNGGRKEVCIYQRQ